MPHEPNRECERLRERLPEYAEGKLTGRARARMERHLAECPRCAAELADLRAVLDAVRAVSPEEAPAELVSRVREAVAGRAPSAPPRTQLLARLAIPAAVVVGLVAVTFALRGPVEPTWRSGGAAQGVVRRAPEAASEVAERHDRVDIAQTRKEGSRLGARGGAAPAPGSRRGVAPEESHARAPVAEARSQREPESDEAAARPRREGPPGPLLRNGETVGGYPREHESDSGEPYKRARPPQFRNAEEARAPRGRGGIGGGMAGAAEQPAAAAEKADAEPGEVHALGATAALTGGEQEPGIAITLHLQRPVGKLTLEIGDKTSYLRLWEDSVTSVGPIPVSSEQLGRGPTSISISLSTEEEQRDYRLFVPVLARLGEVAPNAPVARYDGQAISEVLADLSALTGLVILAEEPLTVPVFADTPSGPPAAAAEHLGRIAGFEVQRAGEVALTLTHAR